MVKIKDSCGPVEVGRIDSLTSFLGRGNVLRKGGTLLECFRKMNTGFFEDFVFGRFQLLQKAVNRFLSDMDQSV